MIAKEQAGIEAVTMPVRLRIVSTPSTKPATKATEASLLWRVVLVAVGFGLAMAGWALVLTVFLSFIGLPMFMFGLALVQAQER